MIHLLAQMNLGPNERPIMDYTDFKLKASVQPDVNGCMWLDISTSRDTLNDVWDMDAECVRRLRDACNEFLAIIEYDTKDS